MAPRDREQVATKLAILNNNRDDITLDIKKLINEPGFRLRVGAWRVIFER